MCGIFAYKGSQNAKTAVYQGLKKLEYRGYDSWGICVFDKSKLFSFKQIGELPNKIPANSLPNSNLGIGHTRWATHGGVTKKNAHPHFSTNKNFSVVHNGIVENYQELKNELKRKGYEFNSQTDTEVIVKLLEHKLINTKDFRNAFIAVFEKLHGRNTILLLTSSGEIYGVKNGSPLVLGIEKEQVFLASDVLAFGNSIKKAYVLENNEFIHINKTITLYNIERKKNKLPKYLDIKEQNLEIDRNGYKYYMLKEIEEQSECVKKITSLSENHLEEIIGKIKSCERVYTIGAGTAGFVAGQVAYYLREIAKVNCTELKAYEVQSYRKLFTSKDLILAFSQSGETADTLIALELAKKNSASVASLVNMPKSTTSRISDFSFFTNVGPEICVASTKVATYMMVWGYFLAKSLVNQDMVAKKQIELLSANLSKLCLPTSKKKLKELAKKLLTNEHFFVLGRGQNYYIALESALKVKEISYKHFEGFSAGELKHGVIALIQKGIPVFVIISEDNEKHHMLSAAQEVKSRGAFVIGVAEKSNEVFDYHVKVHDSEELSAVSNLIVLQFISYYLGVLQKINPDKPRNLAKSVTVS